MSVKYYGMFTAYPPGVDLRIEGLGRLMAEFLKAAETRKDIRFVVACPSWSKQSLLQLCESEGVDPAGFDILAPARQPLILVIARLLRPAISGTNTQQTTAITVFGKSERKKNFKQLVKKIIAASIRYRENIESKIASTRNPLTLLLLGLYATLLGLLLAPLFLAVSLYRTSRTILGM